MVDTQCMINSKKPPQLKGLDFSKEQIEKCVRDNSILRISIEPSKICNLKCPFCYADECYGKSKIAKEDELSINEIKDIIIQAKNLGAKTITLVGGEPLMYPKIREIISFINSNKLISLIFTNGTIMTGKYAEFLYNNNASLIVKFNSFDNPEIQDKMVGNIKGTFSKIKRTIDILIESGFNKSTPTRLAVESVISHTNLLQIAKIFRFARENNIYPYIELITPAGRGKEYAEILSKEEAKKIFYQLLKIDGSEFEYTWVPRPPLVATTCKYYFTAIYVNSNGKVQPCPTVNIELGNLRKEKLSEILNKPKFKRIRNIRENIKGRCKECQYHTDCYGCRGAAFNLTGDIFNSDPICWI